jgi:cytochrome c oxidase cbb3-type subunit 1
MAIATTANAQSESFNLNLNKYPMGVILLVMLSVSALLVVVISLVYNSNQLTNDIDEKSEDDNSAYMKNLTSSEIEFLLQNKINNKGNIKKVTLLSSFLLLSTTLFAQDSDTSTTEKSLFSQPGIIIVFVLILIVLVVVVFILTIKANVFLIQFRENQKLRKARILADFISSTDVSDQEDALLIRKKALDYKLQQNELSGTVAPDDDKGLLNNISNSHSLQLFPAKKNPIKRPKIDPELSKLVLWFLGSAIVWLVIATSIGEYLGIKFVAPDADHFSWLTFGRLRPVHTNLVFWAWSTLGIMGLGYYVIPITSNVAIHSLKLGWLALKLVNVSMFVGAISLMAGINNGGGEYKEMV